MIRVLIVDDKLLVRKGIRALLRQYPDIECIGDARDGREAVELAVQLEPDVITMDINMPHLNGLEATVQILSLRNQIRVLIVTLCGEEKLIRKAVENGALGVVAKSDMFAEIGKAVRAVNSGSAYYSKEIIPLGFQA